MHVNMVINVKILSHICDKSSKDTHSELGRSPKIYVRKTHVIEPEGELES